MLIFQWVTWYITNCLITAALYLNVDPCMMLSAEWYEAVARSRPPKDQPWYRVLVHDSTHETYVAERNLTPDTSGVPVRHPLIKSCFGSFDDGHYSTTGRMN